MTDSPPERTAEKKAKAAILNVLYAWFLEKRSDEWVMAEIARKNLPRMPREEWWRIKHFFREREMKAPSSMHRIREKIGKAC
jgi:hypothetical protein